MAYREKKLKFISFVLFIVMLPPNKSLVIFFLFEVMLYDKIGHSSKRDLKIVEKSEDIISATEVSL